MLSKITDRSYTSFEKNTLIVTENLIPKYTLDLIKFFQNQPACFSSNQKTDFKINLEDTKKKVLPAALGERGSFHTPYLCIYLL